jgi:hypothetical protein
MTYPEPHPLFSQHLPTTTGMAHVKNSADLAREVLIRYPQVKPGVTQTITGSFEEPNVKRFASMWSEWGEHSYVHNSVGFRCHEIETDVDTCYYGCSQTYAQGVPLRGRYGEQLDAMRGTTSNNFGICGNSVDELLNLFMATSSFVRMRTAVFMLPDMARHIMPFMDDKNRGQVEYYNLMYTQQFKKEERLVNHRHTIEDAYNSYFRLPQEFWQDRLRNTVQTIEYIAQLKGIRVIFTSWNRYTYETLMSFMQYPNTPWPLPRWVDPTIDIARDDLHFGVLTHQAHARALAEVM